MTNTLYPALAKDVMRVYCSKNRDAGLRSDGRRDIGKIALKGHDLRDLLQLKKTGTRIRMNGYGLWRMR